MDRVVKLLTQALSSRFKKIKKFSQASHSPTLDRMDSIKILSRKVFLSEVNQREQEIDQELQATALTSIKEDLRVELEKYAVIFRAPKPDKLANMIKDRVRANQELREKYSISDFK